MYTFRLKVQHFKGARVCVTVASGKAFKNFRASFAWFSHN